jgi:hypothetical protein
VSEQPLFEDSERLCAQLGASWENRRGVTLATTFCGKTVRQSHSVCKRSNPSVYPWCTDCQVKVFGIVFR